VARRRSPRVQRLWHLLRRMQRMINNGRTPNAAAVVLAARHWRDIASPRAQYGYEAAVQWLKDNQRKFRRELRAELRQRRPMFRLPSSDEMAALLKESAFAQMVFSDDFAEADDDA
jgi:hypothetical protein